LRGGYERVANPSRTSIDMPISKAIVTERCVRWMVAGRGPNPRARYRAIEPSSHRAIEPSSHRAIAPLIAWSVDVQCDTRQLNIMSAFPKVECEKVASTHTVALTKFASITLLVKVHLKKNPEAEKLDGNRYRIKFPIGYRRVFFDCSFFSGCTFTSKLKVATSNIQFCLWGLPIQAFLGPSWGKVLILSEFI
jgi:hypothetical protein